MNPVQHLGNIRGAAHRNVVATCLIRDAVVAAVAPWENLWQETAEPSDVSRTSVCFPILTSAIVRDQGEHHHLVTTAAGQHSRAGTRNHRRAASTTRATRGQARYISVLGDTASSALRACWMPVPTRPSHRARACPSPITPCRIAPDKLTGSGVRPGNGRIADVRLISQVLLPGRVRYHAWAPPVAPITHSNQPPREDSGPILDTPSLANAITR